jgi:hypothetical protein
MTHALSLEAVQIEIQVHPFGVLLRTVVIGLDLGARSDAD